MADGWVKATSALGGPTATMYVNLRRAIALTRLSSATAIDFTVAPIVNTLTSTYQRIEVLETPEELLELL